MDKSIFNILSIIKKKNKINILPLHEPLIDKIDNKEVSKCLKSNFVSTAGPATAIFEKILQKFTKSKYVICVNSGTSAIHISLLASRVGRNDEILVPSLTFAGTVNPILYVGAVPHFIDSEKESLGIDFDKLDKYLEKITFKKGKYFYNKKTKKKINCIMPVHIFGHAVNIKKLKKISKKYNLMVIEDAAEALGSFFNKQHLGTFGNFGILSFNGNKIITTGSGGAILTNNKKLYNYAKHIASTAKKPHPWKYEHNDLGYNYRMPSLNASLGLSQILKINKILKYKKQLYDYYCKVFKDNENFEILKEPLNADSNYWLQTLIIKKGKTHAHEYIKYANKIGIQCRPLWRLMHKLEHLKKYPKMNLENSIFHERSIINLPSGNNFKF